MIISENSNKNEILDRIQQHINETIAHFIDTDSYRNNAPYLSSSDTKRDNDFFTLNKITPVSGLTSEEYKTIAYLAPFYKNKANYDVNNINRYLEFIGYNLNAKVAEIMCLDKTTTYTKDCAVDYITFTEYLKLDKTDYAELNIAIKTSINNQKIKYAISTEIAQSAYLDGFSLGFDMISLK